MLAKRHLLVLVFAGGCLSGATIIGIWREEVVTTQRDASEPRKVERYREPTSADFVDDATEAAEEPRAANDAPASPKTAEPDIGSPPETGSSVADILHGLEIAYRQNLGATPSPTTTVTPQAPPPAPAETAVAAAAPPAPKAEAPPAAAQPARAAATPDDAPQKVASRDDPRPRDVYLGEVHQNTNVGTVNEGDVYVIEHYVPYVPYLAYPRRAGQAPPAYAPRPMPPRPGAPNAMSQGTFTYSDSVFKYPVELVH